jgi:rRNA-processing protein FCF1
MITNFNLETYQALFQQKRLTELFLGTIPLEWLYAVVEYEADLTVSEPFDLFDKTIVGILLLDEYASITQIGAILGFNIQQDEENRFYRDQAEYDILRDALDSLVDYEMIETGFEYETCRLTRLGREYALKNRKFREDENKTFSLFYDLISENHVDAKTHFHAKDLVIDYSIQNLPFLNDKALRKNIAAVQIPEIWDVEKGHFFKNELIRNAKVFKIELKIAVLYDVETQMNRFLAYDSRSKNFYPFCSDWLWQHRQSQMLAELARLNRQNDTLLPFPTTYKNALIQKKQAFEAIFRTEPQNAIEIAREAHRNLESIEVDYFWNHIASFIPDDAEEVWFLLPNYTDECLNSIKKLQQLNKPIFVMLQNHGTPKNANELYTQTLGLKSCLYMGVTEVRDFEIVIIGNQSKLLIAKYLEITTNDIKISNAFLQVVSTTKAYLSAKIEPTKMYLAQHYLQRMKQSIEEAIQKDDKNSSNLSKSALLSFEDLDQKAQVFMDLKQNRAILNQINELKTIKTSFIAHLKEKHQLKCLKKVEKWQTDFKNQPFSKLEPLDDFNQSLQLIEHELFEDYHALHRMVAEAKQALEQEVTRIKEEVLSKTYVIDTNIFIYEPFIMNKIHIKHKIALSHKVIDELDKLKMNPKTKENAEKVIKIINQQINNNPRLKTYKANLNMLSVDYRQPSPDNMILSVAYSLRDKNPILLTNDNGLQLKAKSIDIPVISLQELLSANTLDDKNGISEPPVSEVNKQVVSKQGTASLPYKSPNKNRKR